MPVPRPKASFSLRCAATTCAASCANPAGGFSGACGDESGLPHARVAGVRREAPVMAGRGCVACCVWCCQRKKGCAAVACTERRAEDVEKRARTRGRVRALSWGQPGQAREIRTDGAVGEITDFAAPAISLLFWSGLP